MPGDVHSSQQREERTKKRRRGYRALSLGGWCRPPGPIKAEGERCTRRFGHSAQRRGIQRTPGCNAGRCSFFSAARRTNQEAPPRLSGFVARRLAPPSGAAELAALRHSSPLSSAGWPPPGPIKAEEERCTRRFGHSALRRGIQKSLGLLFTRCPFQPTRFIVPLDPASGCGVTGCVIPCCDVEAQSFRATTRYPGEENTRHGLDNPAGGRGG